MCVIAEKQGVDPPHVDEHPIPEGEDEGERQEGEERREDCVTGFRV
jgi:hypothetical protein